MKKKTTDSAFQWRKNYFGPKKVKAEDAQAEIERIREEKGAVCAEYIVDAARPKNSILHPEFEWDNTKAAEFWRREQAQRMIRCIVIAMPQMTDPVRAYVLVSNEEAPTGTDYADTRTVVSHRDMFKDALGRLVSELDAARASVSELQNLSEAAADKTRKRGVAAVSRALDKAFDAAGAIQ